MAATLEQIRFVVDENLLGLGRALTHLRRDVALVGEAPLSELLPAGILDSTWIPIMGERGWTMITNDGRVRTRPTEARLAVEHGLRIIHLHGSAGHQPAWQQAIRLLTRWDRVEKQLLETPTGPMWISVRASQVQVMQYDPGGIERL